MNKFSKHTTFIAAAFFMLLFAFNSVAQQDTILVEAQDSFEAIEEEKAHSPKKAMLFSLIPGGGQIYNGKWWKVPIIYAGMGLSAYAAVWNYDQYKVYSDAFDIRTDGNENTLDEFDGIYTDEQLIQAMNYYDKNKETAIVIGVAIYALSILDANVDAHLHEFDVSDDLSINIEPTVFNIGASSYNYSGLRLSFKF